MSDALRSDYWSKAEFAQEIHRDERTLDRWRRLGEGPRFVKIGNEVIYPKDGARQWLKSLEQEPA